MKFFLIGIVFSLTLTGCYIKHKCDPIDGQPGYQLCTLSYKVGQDPNTVANQ